MKVLLLGASGLIGPHLLAGLEPYFDLRLADIKPHPDNRPITVVDVRSYDQVLTAAHGMDAIMNFTVVRPHHHTRSFQVNTLGAWHVMRAAQEVGIRKVVHTGPQLVRNHYDHDFDITDVPNAPGTGYYELTKGLSNEICRTYAKAYGIQTICFLFNGLGPDPSQLDYGTDFPPYTIIWQDLQQACRLALELDVVPDDYQDFDMTSFEGQGKYKADKARRILGYEPSEPWEDYFKRKI
ncbi:MAG: NAD(P)-dependent oxidoreductase [Gemmatimonadetes bacterium]|jgi:nucleoside-diphosphate-sugar epimerase|nr:NAD(P)-dependent oxidoreductase [Gemmatimonadota bacterium]MBT4612820.1 NAD(P)-dependent oxidoreductase [Gemmatimonadota bacterium]MBT5059060.1 NAD(P)-dependent oxidoreductase [Gemmatimonadota bacterium]MBT5144736.1 NAD(P)-dependent oxidoreductase [Gemmatimonadota bacterium]MBT5589595.1 NAD(P)-dependent oxidoreductase [Gemmatimonadota bacterium]